jgi:hypothetical protein
MPVDANATKIQGPDNGSGNPLAVTMSQLPAGTALSDALANPTTTQEGANLLLWDETAAQWVRARALPASGLLLATTDPGKIAVCPTLYDTTSTNFRVAWGAKAAIDGSDGSNLQAVGPSAYNGASFDRWRNNYEITALISATRTATTSSPDQTNPNGRGLHVILNITAASGTGGLQIFIQGKDPVSGNYYNLNATPTAVVATGQTIFEVYPGIGPISGGITQRTSGALPRTFRIQVVHGDASNYTYSVGAAILL